MKYSLIGSLIRSEREKHGWDQAELAARIGLGQQTISRWEKGDSRPRQEKLSSLITIFSVDRDEWWYKAGYQSEEPDQSLAPFLPLGNLSAENFELFCKDLIQYLNPSADVSRYGSKGDTQEGIDLYAKYPDKILDYQCKRKKFFGPKDIDKAVQANIFQASHHYLLLGRSATSDARKAILKYDNWTLWDREDISSKVRDLPSDNALRIVDTYFPGKRKIFLGREEPSPWLIPADFFQPLISRSRLFNHGWNFVGRKEDIEKLEKFEKSTELHAIIISGRGGIGKSRLLKEWSEHMGKEITVRFIAQGAEIRPQDLELLPKGSAFLVIDDAHDRQDILALLTGIARLRPELKLILSTRSYGLIKLQEDLTKAGFSFDREGVVKVTDLTLEDTENLAQEILAEICGNTIHAKRIAEITKDCPLATVIGSHLVAKGQINPELLGNDEEFRAELLRIFRDVITGQIGYSNPEDECNLLNFLAMIQPFNPSDPSFQEAATKLLNRQFNSINRDIHAFEEGGILLRRGNKLRIVPDLLADYIRTDAAYDKNNKMPTGYVNTLFPLAKDELANNVLVNICQIDWKLSVNGEQALLLNQVWTTLKHQFKDAENFRKSVILSIVERVAYYQPAQALDFVYIALETPKDDVKDENKKNIFMNLSFNDVLYKISGILRYVAYSPDYVLETLDILKQLAETDDRPVNQNSDHPVRVLQEIASFEPGKPILYNELVAKHIIGWLGQTQQYDLFSSFDVLDQLLQTEGYQSEVKGITVNLIAYKINPEAVSDLRKLVINAAVATILDRPLKEAFRALNTLEVGLHLPSGLLGQVISPEEKAAWEPKILYIFNRLEELAANSLLDPYIAAGIRMIVSWHLVYGKSLTQVAAKKVLDAIPTGLPYDISRAIIDTWGRSFTTNENLGLNDAEYFEWRKKLAQRLIEIYGKDFPNLILMLEERLNTLSQAKIKDREGVDIGPFLATLFETSPELAISMGEYIITNPLSPLANWFNVVLVVISKQDRDLALQLIKTSMVQQDKKIVQCVANALGYGLYNLPVHDEEVAIIRKIASSSDPWLRRAIVRSLNRFPLEMKSEGLHILLSINISDSVDVADAVLGELEENNGIFKISDLTELEIKNCLDQLIISYSINDYYIGLFLSNVSYYYPKLALQFLFDRIEYKSSNSHVNAYDPLPLMEQEGFRLRFNETSEYEYILKAVRNWYFVKPSNWVLPIFGPRLFKLVSAGFDQVTLKILEEWINSTDEYQLEAVAKLLREANPSFVWENQLFVINLLDNAQKCSNSCYKRVSGLLSISVIQGERFGTSGQPFPQDIEQRDRSFEIMNRLPIGSPAFKFFKLLYETAKIDIAQSSSEDFDLE